MNPDSDIERCSFCGRDLEPSQIGKCDDCREPTDQDPLDDDAAEPDVSWMVEWSSSTARGNVRYSTPESWSRAKVIAQWESLNGGCNVDRLNRRSD